MRFSITVSAGSHLVGQTSLPAVLDLASFPAPSTIAGTEAGTTPEPRFE